MIEDKENIEKIYENEYKSSYTRSKEIIKGIAVFILYFILSYSVILPVEVLGIDYENLSIMVKQLYLIFYNILFAALFVYIYRHDLKLEFVDFKENYKEYFKKYIKYWLFALTIMYVSNAFIATLKYSIEGTISTAENEELIRQTLSKAPIYTFIEASFIAPILEELTFRKSLRKIFNNDIAFIMISSLIFGGLHVFTSGFELFDLLYLIPYCAPGFAFAIILTKSKNTFNTISLHLMHNTILMVLQIVLLTRGLL